jgi:phospholipid/cholesterol/gamma-HCH transport system substrate-binding protein
MTESKTEILVGGLVLAVAVGFLVFAGQTIGMTRGAEEYRLNASFRSIDGVSIGTDVRMAGVKIGRVTDISLDPETYRAQTVFTVEQGIEVPDDSAVSISSEGLLGGNYVEIQPGGSPFYLAAGDEIEFTQSSIGLISLLTKFVSGESGASE